MDFNTQIRPILSNKCYACHGPDEAAREAGLRLDNFEGATEDLGDYQAVVPGKPDESVLLERIVSDDEDMRMPPVSHGEPLSPNEIELFKSWITKGATYDLHWAYQAPKPSEIPKLKSAWIRNSIDHYVLWQMKVHKLQPSPEADRYALIRRVAFDVTGLPPTPDEVNAFINDSAPGAYEKMVDHFLSKPAYAERWAAVWLDLARYADSAGYAEDKKRTIWAYRDYVIRSYLENKPFDQFTIEQIAGDLMPNAIEESRIATAFHRNTLTNSEGGTSDEEFRNSAIVDRVNTTMAVWMGTTMACAQCHTHKYDPITQDEYFQFFDFFNQTEDNDQPNENPVMPIFSESDLRLKTEIEEQIRKLNVELATNKPTPTERVNLEQAIIKNELKKFVGQFVRIDLPGQGKILSLAEVQVFANNSNIALNGKTRQSSTDYDGDAQLAVDGNTDGNFDKKSVTHTRKESNPWWELDLGDTHPISRISVWNRVGGTIHNRLDGYRISILDKDRNVVWSNQMARAQATEQVLNISDPPQDVKTIANKPSATRSNEESKILTRFIDQYLLDQNPTHRKMVKLNAELGSIRPISTVPIMVERPNDKQRITKVQIRGNFQDTGETVSRGTPDVLHSMPKEAPKNRLGLAKWLVDSNNPLTARVVVNRYWEQVFGTGIVATVEEFGAQGELPSHPQLLDHLALELIKSDWDTKQILKKIVMSASYRQSSVASKEKIESDPANRWISRGPRVRMSAEMIRDQALAVSGLLSDKMFGPPVQPPQPKVGLKPAFTGQTTDWQDSTGPDRYRRAIYTEWRRSSPYPSMSTFDVSNREVC